MNRKSTTYQLVVAALMVALGILIPFVTGHAFGMAGTVFLPMHFSVLIAGFIIGPAWGLAVGMVTPALSSVLTGMPVLFPMMPVMVIELGVYGWMTGYLYRKKNWNMYLALIVSMICGRIGHAVVFALLMFASKGMVGLSTLAFITEGIPGTILQLIIVPLLVTAIYKGGLAPARETGKTAAKDIAALIAYLKERIQKGEISLALIRDGKVIYTDLGMGVGPLLKILNEQPEILKGAILVDKLVGKAAAMMAVYGEVSGVHALSMSRAGSDYLAGHALPFTTDRTVELIENNEKTGICPFENAVLDLEDPAAGLEAISATMEQMRAKKKSAQ